MRQGDNDETTHFLHFISSDPLVPRSEFFSLFATTQDTARTVKCKSRFLTDAMQGFKARLPSRSSGR
jgi:hypothetical protein